MPKKPDTIPNPNTNEIEGYVITVQGQMFSRDPKSGLKTQKFYKDEKFYFPKIVSFVDGKEKVEVSVDGVIRSVAKPKISKANALNVCQHLIRKYHIEDRLKEKYPDVFTGVRTMEVFAKEKAMIDPDEFMDVTKKPIAKMSKSELLQLVAIHGLKVQLSGYSSLADQKTAVEQAIKQKKSDDKSAGKSGDMSEEDKLLMEPESSSLFG